MLEDKDKNLLQKKRKCPENGIEEEKKSSNFKSGEDTNKEHKDKDKNLLEPNSNLNEEEMSDINVSNSEGNNTEKGKDKQKKPKGKKVSEMTRDELIIKEEKKKNNKTLEKLIQNGFENFLKKTKNYEFYLLHLIRIFSNLLGDFKEFKEDYTYYIYNNLRVLIFSKELNEALKAVTYKNENEKYYNEFLKFTTERWNIFERAAKNYKIKLYDEYVKSYEDKKKKQKDNLNIINNVNIAENNNSNIPINSPEVKDTTNTSNNNTNGKNSNNTSNNSTAYNTSHNSNNIPNNSNSNNISNNANNEKSNTPESNNNENNKDEQNKNKESEEEKFDINKTFGTYRKFPEENQLEIIVAGLVYNCLIRNEKDLIKEIKLDEKDKNSIAPTVPTKIEIQNFNLPEMPMISIISGFKYYTNIIEINLSGNSLSPKSCFWLGSVNKTNPNLTTLDISRCNIDNDKLYMFVEGASFSYEKWNQEQFNLQRLNLKDNSQINDKTNEDFEHPLALILEKFKLRWINLTNAKIGGFGALKFIEKMGVLLNQNKFFLENLILICNDFKNEECLSKLGEVLLKQNCPLKNIILSKNLISTPNIPKPNDELKSNHPQITPTPRPPTENINPNLPLKWPKDKINHFQKFMECVGKSNVKELFLISCDIGIYENDVNILYDMLKANKSLISIRLFGNKISQMDSFRKILGIFSDYNKELENNTLKSLDLSKNSCHIKVEDEFMKLVEHLKLEYLDVNQNTMDANEKEIFKKRTNDLANIKIIY